MKAAGQAKKAYVEKMGTVTINMDEYVRAGADADVLRMVINKIDDLPSLPLIIHKILSLTQDENSQTSQLAKVISNDQALTAKVLRIANSPLYHVSSVVTSISHAVTLLGFRTIRNLALGLSTIDTFNESEDSQFLPRQQFWEHSLACAHCCKAVADRIRHRLPDEAFVGGLLHDIGRMVFTQFFPESFNHALREALVTRRPLIDLEREEVGIPHTLVGKLLLQKWKLPPSLADAVQSHHKPRSNDGGELAKTDISLIIMIADTLSKIACIGSGGDTHVYTADQDILRSIPLGEGDYVTILTNLSKHVKDIKGFFGIKEDPSQALLSPADVEDRGRLRLAFYGEGDNGSFVPVRAMLKQFFKVGSFPVDADIKTSIEQIDPQLVFVDLSSEADTDRISEILKAYRNVTQSPIILLLSKKVSQETKEKSAKVGIFFLVIPFSPQEMFDCLSQTNLLQ